MAYGLLNSIAIDLDCMLNELCESSAVESKSRTGRNQHEPSSTLPHAAAAQTLRKQAHTVPRGRDVLEQRVRRSARRTEKHVRSNDGKMQTVNNNTNPTGGGCCGQVLGNEFDKVPGVDGYQNDPERLQLVNRGVASEEKTAAAAEEEEESGGDYAHPRHMSLLERLIVTHSVWLLRGIYRAGAVHLLQGKEEGNFIIRQSSREETMAITVRLPADKGPYIEHYLIEAVDGKLRLEGSENLFPAIPMLVSHYCQCCDELPVCLKLPRAVVNANTKQELSALALLGQDFWMSPLATASLKPSNSKPKLALPLLNNHNNINNNNINNTRPTFSSFSSPPAASSSSSTPSSPSSSSLTSSPTKKVAPPPPPRRSLSEPTTAEVTVTTTVTFHVNHGNGLKTGEELIAVDGETSASSPIPSEFTECGHQLESPPGYHRSSLADKISDYEDIWVSKQSPDDSANQTDLEKAMARLSSSSTTAKNHHPLTDLKSLSKIYRHSDPNLVADVSSSAQNNKTKSGFNSEPETLNQSAAAEDLVVGGIINNGFQSSSSQLVVSSDVNSDGGRSSTLPRTNGDKRKSEILKVIQDLMGDQSLSPNATLKATHNNNKSFNQNSWPLDFSWEFRSRNGSTLVSDSSDSSSTTSLDREDDEDLVTEDDEVALVELRNKPTHPRSAFRVFSSATKSPNVTAVDDETVEQLLTEKQPQLKLPEIRPLTHSNLLRVSEYDNLGSSETEEDDDHHSPLTDVNRLTNGVELRVRNVPSEAGSSMTEFSEPWDSHRWETILMQAAALKRINKSSDRVSHEPPPPLLLLLPGEKEEDDDLQSVSSVADTNEEIQRFVKIPVLPCLLSLRRKDRRQGKPIRNYVFKMAQDKDLVFGRHIENFIACTLESNEGNPHVVMRNIRQFMSGMANFLVNSGEGKFSELVQEQRAKLKPNEFLNLDAILEGVLHRIVVKPLKAHIYQLFVQAYSGSGAVAMLSDSIKYARSKTPQQLGIKANLQPPKALAMEKIKHYFSKLQRAYSPLKKLENLLAAISFIYQSILQEREGEEHHSVGADDFLPLLLYVLVHCGMIAAEVEAEYMWGLLHPSLLSGEGGYYLSTLSSAVHVLKNLHRMDSDAHSIDSRRMAVCLGELDGFMKVLIPNELNGSIICKTVPVRPNMTSKDIGRMVAHCLSVTNPQDYALFKLVNGEEILLGDSCSPWRIRMEVLGAGLELSFVYKRMDAKIAWPVSLKKTT